MRETPPTGSDQAIDRKRSAADPDQAAGTLFRQVRQELRLSQEQLAAMTYSPAVSRTTISAIERGRVPSLGALVSLCRALHVDPLAIFERVELAALAGRSCGGVAAATGPSHEALHRRAEELLLAGDFAAALAVWDDLLRREAVEPDDDPAERCARARIEIGRARALEACGASRAAEQAAQNAVELSRSDRALQIDALLALARLWSRWGRLALACLVSECVVARASPCSESLRLRAARGHAEVLQRAGSHDEARHCLLEARKLALEIPSPREAAEIDGALGISLAALGRSELAKERLRRAVEAAHGRGDSPAEACWRLVLGRLALDDGDLAQAEHQALATLRLARAAGGSGRMFEAEWLHHRIAVSRGTYVPDSRRLRRLRRLWVALGPSERGDSAREFEALLLESATSRRTPRSRL